MKEYLPEKIRIRKDKIGFGTPQDEWFREERFIRFLKEIIKLYIIQTKKYCRYSQSQHSVPKTFK